MPRRSSRSREAAARVGGAVRKAIVTRWLWAVRALRAITSAPKARSAGPTDFVSQSTETEDAAGPSGPGRFRFIFLAPMTDAFGVDEQKRDQENSENGGCNHTAEYRRADGMAGDRAGAMRDDQREQTEDESEARHHDRTKP